MSNQVLVAAIITICAAVFISEIAGNVSQQVNGITASIELRK